MNNKRILLVGINAKFIHSNLAILYLQKYIKKKSNINIDLKEFTINQYLEDILREIYLFKPDVIGFSCYIWNFEMIKALTIELKKTLKDCTIILGGPEVSFNPLEVIEKTNADIVIMGEGEEALNQLLIKICNNQPFDTVKSIAFNGKINELMTPIDMEDIPFVYDDFSGFDNKIIYYEASRGCPFNCQYCLSGRQGGVRGLPLRRVFEDLKKFLDSNISQVKFVDRTFNYNKEIAMAIWKYLSENDNGITNFHFEIAAELLDDEIIAFLNTVRKGLFQFEIGVQSTNKETLKAIKRVTLPEKLTPIVEGLQKGENIHLHLDLIAGLPYEGISEFKNSFNYVYSLSPDQFQLGFLKLLKGSGLYKDKEKYGIVYTDFAPYEVLYTNSISFDEILHLKMIENMLENYYNSNRYKLSIEYIVSFFDTSYDFYEQMGLFYQNNLLHLAPHNKLNYYIYLYDFAKNIKDIDLSLLKSKILFDIYSHEKAKSLPDFIDSNAKKYYKEIFDFYDEPNNREKYLKEYNEFDTKQIIRQAHIEVFNVNPINNKKELTSILFNYRVCDILGNAKFDTINIKI